MDGLEVDREEVDEKEECGVETEDEEAGGPDCTLKTDSCGYGCVVTDFRLDEYEGEEEHT